MKIMKNLQTFENFTQDINESMSSYYFNSPSEFYEYSDMAPKKGETKYLVMATNKADFNGQEVRLEVGIRFGSSTNKKILGIFEEDQLEDAKDVLNAYMKKPEGTFISTTLGKLVGISKFKSQYTEIEGNLAKIKVN